jgi:hypothetical protein
LHSTDSSVSKSSGGHSLPPLSFLRCQGSIFCYKHFSGPTGF